ncbi:hypothetical protein L083_1636 [Actinoplanes sp. N902-109]|nr:hypothetical protein L083_1636 [Actinoplanes sp. N902-109]
MPSPGLVTEARGRSRAVRKHERPTGHRDPQATVCGGRGEPYSENRQKINVRYTGLSDGRTVQSWP